MQEGPSDSWDKREVLQPARAVLMGDGGDGGAQRRDTRAGLAALGQVRGDEDGRRAYWLDALGRAPRLACSAQAALAQGSRARGGWRSRNAGGWTYSFSHENGQSHTLFISHTRPLGGTLYACTRGSPPGDLSRPCVHERTGLASALRQGSLGG